MYQSIQLKQVIGTWIYCYAHSSLRACLSIYLFVHLVLMSVHMSIGPAVCLTVCLSVCLPACPPVCRPGEYKCKVRNACACTADYSGVAYLE